MQEIPCFCGSKVRMELVDMKYLVDGCEVFCSPHCFLSYLQSLPECRIPPEYALGMRGKDAHDCYACGLYFRSKFEMYVYVFLRGNSVVSLYEEVSLPYGPRRIYIPDFYIPSKDAHLEVKGAWHGSGRAKFVSAVQDGYRMILLPSYLRSPFKRIASEYAL